MHIIILHVILNMLRIKRAKTIFEELNNKQIFNFCNCETINAFYNIYFIYI